MGDKELDAKAVAPQSSYKIVPHLAKSLPKSYSNMIYSKFLRSLKYGNDWFRLIDNEVYFDVYEKFIEKLLEKDSAIIYLATLSDDEDVVLGWALMEPGILHYVFVNPEQRYQGIAKALVGGKYHTITHLTNTGAKIFAKNKDIKFNPFYN